MMGGKWWDSKFNSIQFIERMSKRSSPSPKPHVILFYDSKNLNNK